MSWSTVPGGAEPAQPAQPAQQQPPRQQAPVGPPLRIEWGLLMAHDVGTIVLRHLASTQERVRICRSVSKECRALVDSQVHSLRANLRTLGTHSSASEAAGGGLPLQFPRLRALSFDRASLAECSALLRQLLAGTPELLSRISSLDLSDCQGVEPDVLAALLQAAPALRELVLPPLAGSVSASRQEFIHVLCEHGGRLTGLHGLGDYLDAPGVPLLAAALTGLTSLDITPGAARPLLTPAGLAPLLALTGLRALSLGSHLARAPVCELVARLPALEALEFGFVDGPQPPPSELAGLRGSRSLRRLALAGLDASDELLQLLAKPGGGGVTSLSLHAGRFSATPKGAALLGGQLAALSLRVADRDVGALAVALPGLAGSSLTSLRLAVHRAAADCGGLAAAVFGLPQLRSLSLQCHYTGFKEAELAGLPVARRLEALSLSNHFSDASLAAVLRAAPGLRSLHLASCGAVGDAGLAAVPSLCRRLRDVRLELLRGAGAAGAAALAAGPCMERLVLEGCRNVTADELDRSVRCGQCRHLVQLKA